MDKKVENQNVPSHRSRYPLTKSAHELTHAPCRASCWHFRAGEERNMPHKQRDREGKKDDTQTSPRNTSSCSWVTMMRTPKMLLITGQERR